MKLSHIRKIMETYQHVANMSRSIQQKEILEKLGLEPGDIYQELEMDSRYVDTHRDISTANGNVNLHSHTFYELLYCRGCSGVEYLVGTERYRLQKGDIIVIRPGISHRPLMPEHMQEPYVRDVIWINGEFLQALEKGKELSSVRGKSLLRTANTKWEYLGDHFDAGVREAQNGNEERELAVIGNTVTLLAHLHRAFSDPVAAPMRAEKPELLDRVLSYVENHLAQRITLEEVARQFFVSESTITQTFRKKMGVSFYRCVTQRRLISAKSLIRQGVALEDVAERTGFSDYSTFYRAFKKEYGISPRQFRSIT